MFSSHKTPAKAQRDGYDDEQHLVAAVSEFKKVEASNQSMVDQLHQRLASPFQVTTKPCEAGRAAVLQCYQQLQGSSAVTTSNAASSTSPAPPPGAHSDSKSANLAPDEAWLSIPYQQCYETALAYHQCVEDTLATHLALVAAFEQRRTQQKIGHQSVVKAQDKPQ
ncbi:conserved hypothetical protein [Leishmania mexicana MHOM/GT/2001/U1103]|uniref:Uncharacterized protein n=1 Tax=Leishmania mexicana (strain MHOM/GT/2001/U1103) TaxID=929439 RepID=E9B5W9_LEIMU|nr:conserved hypothetical protein [Leishmania mexicana MHOM/GT/2001/U1103]CBZ30640.1 conserved hypothetical protein [Leishmania mexicana MHOM/GT/2001/U1103]